MSYRLRFERRVFKDLERISKYDLIRIDRAIQSLALQPFPVGVKKLVGETSIYRLRQGDYRILYTVDKAPKVIRIIGVRHRKESYRQRPYFLCVGPRLETA